MKRQFFISMLIFGIFIFVISALITLNVFFQQSLQNEIAEQFNKQQLLIAKTITSDIQLLVGHLSRECMSISRLLSRSNLNNVNNIKDVVDAAFGKREDLRVSVKILDPDGVVRYSSSGEPVKIDYSFVKRINLQRGEVNILQRDRELFILAGIYRDSSLMGFVFYETSIEDIAQKFLAPITSGERGYAWMMDAKGNLLYHPTKPEMVGRNVYHAERFCFDCHISFEVEKKMLEGKTTEHGRYLAPYGEDKILAFSKASFGDVSWIICVSSPYSEVTKTTKDSMRLYSWLIISIFITISSGALLTIAINKRRVKAEERLRYIEMEEKLEMEKQMMHAERLAALGRLAAGVAHEIGNPLTSISSFVQILKERAEDDFAKESLDTILNHIHRIADIVREMSSFSKVAPIELSYVEINNLIEQSLELVRYDRRMQHIKVIKSLDHELPKAFVDGNQLSQVFVNLILNAVDAMPDGGILTITSRRQNSNIEIEFSDTGVGIPKENIGKVFDPFFTTRAKGTGLGLSVSYNIIKRFNGGINVESEEGKGAKFTISLPTRGEKNGQHIGG